MKLNNYKIKIELIPKGKIIAYKTDEHLSIDEFNSLPKNIQNKFKPIHEHYKVKYLKSY